MQACTIIINLRATLNNGYKRKFAQGTAPALLDVDPEEAVLSKERIMPQRNEPIKERPKVEDESTGNPNPTEQHGKHRDDDEGLPGKGGTKGGLNKQSGGDSDPS